MDADRAQRPTAGSTEASARRGPAPDATAGRPVGASTDLLEADPAGGGWGQVAGPGPPASRPEHQADRRRARRRLTSVYAVGVALLLAGVSVAVGVHGQLHRTADELTVARSRLHRTIDRAHQAEVGLAAVTAQSTAAGRALATEASLLAAAQAQLASTEANVFANGVSINELDTCLAGVERALNQISLNDQGGAAASLNGVAAACRAAEPST